MERAVEEIGTVCSRFLPAVRYLNPWGARLS